MKIFVVVLLVLVVLFMLGYSLGVRIVKQYEQGVLFRLGRVRDAALARHRGGGSPAS